MRQPSRRFVSITAVSIATTGTVAFLASELISHHHVAGPPKAVSTIDRQPRACLLTGAHADTATADRAWTGIRQAATQLQTLTVQRYSLPSGVTPSTYLRTLAQMRCTVVITVGDDLHPQTETTTNTSGPRYITISGHPQPAPHTTNLTPADATTASIAATVTDAITEGPRVLRTGI